MKLDHINRKARPGARTTNLIVDAVNELTDGQAVIARQVAEGLEQTEDAGTNFTPDTIDPSEGATPNGAVSWQEISRQESTVRVENPDDSDQFVNITRIDFIMFENDEGDLHSFTFDNG